MTRVIVLSATPLSAGYAALVAGVVDGVVDELAVLSRLRTLPLRSLLVQVFRLRRSRVYIACEDPATRSLVPLLELFAIGLLPERIWVVDGADLRSVSVTSIPRIAALLIGASLGARLAARRATAQLRELEDAPRSRPRLTAAKKVLYLNTNLWFGLKAGGSVAHMTGIINGFVRSGLDVEVSSLTPPPLRSPRVSIRPLGHPGVMGLPAELNHYRIEEEATRGYRNHGADQYGFVYQRLSVHSYAGAAISRQLGVPLVVEYNGSEVWVARNWGKPLRYERLASRSEAALLRHAQLVVTVSDVLARELEDRGVPAERILSHANGFDPTALDPQRFSTEELRARRRSLGVSEGGVMVVFIGTFGRWHGTEILARSIRSFAESDPKWLDDHGVHFVIIGDGLGMPEVRAILEGPAARYSTLTGLVPQDEAPVYLAAADIAVSPHVPNEDGSEFFGSPTKLFEYMGLEKAIIASDLGQIGEVLKPALSADALPVGEPEGSDQRVAVLTRPGDVPDLTRAIRFLVEAPGWRASLGRRAREKALREYTWDDQVARILQRLRGTS